MLIKSAINHHYNYINKHGWYETQLRSREFLVMKITVEMIITAECRQSHKKQLKIHIELLSVGMD